MIKLTELSQLLSLYKGKGRVSPIQLDWDFLKKCQNKYARVLDSVNNRSSKQSILIYLKIIYCFRKLPRQITKYANKSGWKETKNTGGKKKGEGGNA